MIAESETFQKGQSLDTNVRSGRCVEHNAFDLSDPHGYTVTWLHLSSICMVVIGNNCITSVNGQIPSSDTRSALLSPDLNKASFPPKVMSKKARQTLDRKGEFVSGVV